jgi:hypothetical protein
VRRSMLLPLLLWFAVPLSAHDVAFSITPSTGPVAGGTEVTIQGEFAATSYVVLFGDAPATSTTRVDEHTLVAITPAHFQSLVPVRIFENDRFISTGRTFEFLGELPASAYARLLVPVLTAPIPGAFGSEFRTELHGFNTGTETFEVRGLPASCRPSPPICPWITPKGVLLEPFGADLADDLFIGYDGQPGRFIDIPRTHRQTFSTSLRVYDTSRSAENFGTEIPVVPVDEFMLQPFALLGVPLDAQFRNTLRLYAETPTKVRVQIGDQEPQVVTLTAGPSESHPAYAQFSSFPTGTGTTRVIIERDNRIGPAIWGFISVTNNATQHITTITPR